ncbi:hypothetical protein BsWGS_24560 [Bradybaena similaris]
MARSYSGGREILEKRKAACSCAIVMVNIRVCVGGGVLACCARVVVLHTIQQRVNTESVPERRPQKHDKGPNTAVIVAQVKGMSPTHVIGNELDSSCRGQKAGEERKGVTL